MHDMNCMMILFIADIVLIFNAMHVIRMLAYRISLSQGIAYIYT